MSFTPWEVSSLLANEVNITKLINFIKESNKIEGEETDPKKIPLLAIRYFLKNDLTEKSLLKLHGVLSKDRDILAGEYRTCQVYVGKYTPPPPKKIHKLMEKYFQKISFLDSFEAHNEFEAIHPFEDLNGRMGRFIWLHKELQKGYSYRIGFLHKFYYQCLDSLTK